MRRKDRILDEHQALQIIDECEYAVISAIDDNEIFSIPISIARDEKSIFIHGAVGGTKQKLFSNGKDVTLVCVSYNKVPIVSKEQLNLMKDDYKALGSKVFTTEYKSAICKSKAYLIKDDEAKIKALRLLCEKYTPNYMSTFEVAARGSLKVTNIYELKITSLSAKAKILPKK